jgi:hypothetical protein
MDAGEELVEPAPAVDCGINQDVRRIRLTLCGINLYCRSTGFSDEPIKVHHIMRPVDRGFGPRIQHEPSLQTDRGPGDPTGW